MKKTSPRGRRNTGLPRTASRVAQQAGRLDWLDGIRALAALFVVVHHSWLMTVGGYPTNNGPWYTDWMIYGHLAVSVFIVVSGFSLSISPSRHELQLIGGGKTFMIRRFWRIVPPYWAALLFVTILIALGLTEPANGPVFSVKDFAIYALLVQDAFANVSPNGAFWSIAVEWHIYFLFPLVMIVWRRWGIARVMLVVTLGVLAQHLLSFWIPFFALFERFTPAYFVLFVAGGSAAVLVHRRVASRTAIFTGIFLGIVALLVMWFGGSVRATSSYFWLDLCVGMATAAIFVGLGQNRLTWVSRVLSFRWLAFVGEFAFSLYLIHAPVLAVIATFVVRPAGLSPMASLVLLLCLGLPAALVVSYCFFLVCERPFLTIRSTKQLVAAVRSIPRTLRKSPEVLEPAIEIGHVGPIAAGPERLDEADELGRP